MKEWTYGLLVGLAFVLGAMFAPTSCATVTDPPPDWPPGSSCAQDPSGPGCYGPVHDRTSPDGGR